MPKQEPRKSVSRKVEPKKLAPKKRLKKPVTKVVAKKPVKKVEIKAKKVGNTLIVVMPDGKTIKKPNIADKELSSIQNKILLFNKIPSDAKLKQIKSLLETEKEKTKEQNKGKSKVISKIIKETKSKSSSSKIIESIDSIKEKLRSIKVSEDEMNKLDESIKEEEKEVDKATTSNPVEKVVDDGTRSRERYR